MKAKNYRFYFLFIFGIAFSSAQVPTEPTEGVPTLIEVLQDGESFSIEITSIGCFGGTRQLIVLSKDLGRITAHFQENTRELTRADILAFIKFEKGLRALKMGGCTTVDTYILRYENKIFQTSDSTCSWYGYRQILNVFNA